MSARIHFPLDFLPRNTRSVWLHISYVFYRFFCDFSAQTRAGGGRRTDAGYNHPPPAAFLKRSWLSTTYKPPSTFVAQRWKTVRLQSAHPRPRSASATRPPLNTQDRAHNGRRVAPAVDTSTWHSETPPLPQSRSSIPHSLFHRPKNAMRPQLLPTAKVCECHRLVSLLSPTLPCAIRTLFPLFSLLVASRLSTFPTRSRHPFTLPDSHVQ